MSKKILIIKANPDNKSFGEALANNYKKGAIESKNEVKEISLTKLNLQKYLNKTHKSKINLDKKLSSVQKMISWADHLVFQYPIWWASHPAILREFIETIFSSGFAFRYRAKNEKGFPVVQLLKGKSARIIATMDSPPIFYKLFIGNPEEKIMKKGVLKFCGVNPVKINYFGSIKMSSEKKKEFWLKKVYELGKNES